jgi:predicted nuclease with RNAse H fold
VRALGIDVGVAKGLDLVLLDGDRTTLDSARHVSVEDLHKLVPDFGPDVVAIDAPPAWAANGRSRLTERELRWFGIQCFNTPSDPKMAEHPFYEWMTIGFRAFDVIAEGFPRYRTGSVKGSAIEVFPHATAVVLSGFLPPKDMTPHAWRRGILRSNGVEAAALRSADQVDAALAALTGLYALERRFSAPGDPREGQIVVPSATLPAHPYRRATITPAERQQPSLPGLSACACGDPACTSLTGREFAPGHDAKRKSALWALARQGQDAVDELHRRRWAVPPEMR